MFNQIDDLSYEYVGNQLMTVNDAGEDDFMTNTPLQYYNNNHFLDNGSKGLISTNTEEYAYDKNGNLISDDNKEISSIIYNHLNLPTIISWDDGRSIEWIYSASGEKLQKTVKDANGAEVSKKAYLGGYEYTDEGLDGTWDLEAIYHNEGRITPTEDIFEPYQYEYTIKDHLGNGRVWWRWNEQTNQPEVLQTADYYPFGLEHANPDNVQIGVTNPYKFNGSITGEIDGMKEAGLGMEEVTDHGLNIYHAFYRTYDPVIGRMMQIDPLAEEPGMISMTPYNAFLNNPILYSDPNGDEVDFSDVQTKNPTFAADIVSDLSNQTGLDLSISPSGTLDYATTTNKRGKVKADIQRDASGNKIGSRSARKSIKSAINDAATVSVIDNPGGGNFVPGLGSNTINVDDSQIGLLQGSVSSDLNNETMGAGMVFTHELGHTGVGGAKPDIDRSNPRQEFKTGPNVRAINKNRRQLGRAEYGRRSTYLLHRAGGTGYLPMSRKGKRQLKRSVAPTEKTITIP
ncbi:MAG: hypothetical protein GY751_16230 [Bacteroidetes bacterium]|nr:hypothetical protein [Bacteroidota bacterium]